MRGPEDRMGNKWKDAKAKAEKEGKVILTSKDYDTCMAMATNAFMHCDLLKETVYSDAFVAEASIFTTCSKTNVDIKVRPDGLIVPQKKTDEPYIIDIKTTRTHRQRHFIGKFGGITMTYKLRFTCTLCAQAGLPCRTMYLIAVEKNRTICHNSTRAKRTTPSPRSQTHACHIGKNRQCCANRGIYDRLA